MSGTNGQAHLPSGQAGAPARSARRRSAAPTKGDLREQAILDAAEALLERPGFEAMTMADIAERAGISRGALYFYFGSKQDVLTGLFARTVELLRQKSRDAASESAEPRAAIETAMRRTQAVWTEHGAVLRAAIDQASSVPGIDALWTETADIFIQAIAGILQKAGVPPGASPQAAPALARCLCWMIERSYYRVSAASPEELNHATEACIEIWARTAGLA